MPLLALSRWPWWRRWFGNRSERAAARYLKRLGCPGLTHNYLCPGGDLALVAPAGRCLVFGEVRSTANRTSERATESVTAEKQRRMTHAARHFLHRHRFRDPICRFDVLILSWPPDVREPHIQHFP